MPTYALPETRQNFYQMRYEEKAIGPVPEVVVGIDYGDKPDTCVYAVYSVDRLTGKIVCLDSFVRPLTPEGWPHER